jgi:hypothetical protein
VTSAPAALPLWAATSRNAANARIASSPTTLAATGIVPSVSPQPGTGGWQRGPRNCSPCLIATSSLLSPNSLRHWHCRTSGRGSRVHPALPVTHLAFEVRNRSSALALCRRHLNASSPAHDPVAILSREQQSAVERRCPVCHVGVLRVVEWLLADPIPSREQVRPTVHPVDSS